MEGLIYIFASNGYKRGGIVYWKEGEGKVKEKCIPNHRMVVWDSVSYPLALVLDKA